MRRSHDHALRLSPRLLLALVPLLLAAAAARVLAQGDEPAPPPKSPAPPASDGTPPSNSPTPPVVTPAAPTAAPKIGFDRTEHDFGPAKQNDKRTTSFRVRNDGGTPLHASVRGECGCTGVAITAKDAKDPTGGTPTREIAPGDEALLWVTFDTYRFVGPLDKSIHVTSDDPTSRESTLKIKIDVSAGVVLKPQNFFFNQVLVGAQPTSTIEVKWKEGVGKPFKITAVEPTNVVPAGTKFDFHSEPFDAPPWHGYRVTMSFPEPPGIGMVTGSATIRTDDPENPKVSALIGGSIAGKVVVTLSNPNFGVVPEGRGGTLSIQVRPFDATIALGKVTATSRKGTVKVKLTSADEPQLKGVWALDIELPKDAPLGAIEDVIDITTEVPGYETKALPVVGAVVAK